MALGISVCHPFLSLAGAFTDIFKAALRKPHCPTLRQDTRTADAVAPGARRAQLRAPRGRPSCLATSSTCFPRETRQLRARRKCCRPWGLWVGGRAGCGVVWRTFEVCPTRMGRRMGRRGEQSEGIRTWLCCFCMFRGVMISNLKPSPTFSSVATRVVPSVGQNMPGGPMGSTKVRRLRSMQAVNCEHVLCGCDRRRGVAVCALLWPSPGSSASLSSAWRADNYPQQRLEPMLRAVPQPASGVWPGHGASYVAAVHIVCTISAASWERKLGLPSESGILFDMTPSAVWLVGSPAGPCILEPGREALTR